MWLMCSFVVVLHINMDGSLTVVVKAQRANENYTQNEAILTREFNVFTTTSCHCTTTFAVLTLHGYVVCAF